MHDALKLLIFMLGYVVLMKWLLPWLGIPTCMSGACSVPARRKSEIEQESEDLSNEIGKPTPER
jgi:hypothetical protein